MIKLVDEEHTVVLTQIINDIYGIGKTTQDWLNTIFVPIPKKAGATSVIKIEWVV